MKICKTCGVSKDESEFSGARLSCKKCGCCYAKVHRENNLEAQREADRRQALKRRQLINLLKMERPCYDCGGMFPIESTDWDHMPGTEKKFTIGSNQNGVSLEACLEEINKCQLICSNCHRIRTAIRRQEPPESATPQLAAGRRSYRKRIRTLNLLKQDRPCYDCGGIFPPEATDWDHLPGKGKVFRLADCKSHTLEACLDEINKCQLVCSNCHRSRTEARKQKKGDE